MYVNYAYEIENTRGEKSKMTESVYVDSGDLVEYGVSDLFNHLYAVWTRNLTRLITFGETVGVVLDRISVKDDSDWKAIPNDELTNDFPEGEQAVRLRLASTMDDGDTREDFFDTTATSGREAKNKFWSRLKRDGAGFCMTAARVASLTLTVERRQQSETVIFDRADLERAKATADAGSYHVTPKAGEFLNRSLGEYMRVGDFNSFPLRQAMRANQKINYIKTLREVFGLGLLEAKDITEYRFDHNRAYFE